AGDTGLATEVLFNSPGVTFGPLQWPAPGLFRSPDGFLTSYGYDGQVLLFTEATTPARSGSTLDLRAEANILVCEVDCIPADLVLTLSLPVGPAPIPDASARAFFAAEASRVPLAAVAAGFAVRFEPGASDAEALRGTLIVESADGSALPPVEP